MISTNNFPLRAQMYSPNSLMMILQSFKINFIWKGPKMEMGTQQKVENTTISKRSHRKLVLFPIHNGHNLEYK